jgi:NADPH2:quinone reductase
MRAVLCRELGPPEGLVIEDLPDPVPGPGEVVVEVRCAALNFFDTLIIQGKYQFKPELPFSPGGELAGVVGAVGSAVSDFRPGDRVAAYAGWGGCRERLAVPAEKLVRVPDGLADEVAAGLTITYGTALHGLEDRAGLKRGENLVVLGAAGGAGLAAVEIGKLLGARVIACASSTDKLALARAAGADELLNYGEEDLREGLRRLCGDRGVDVLYDPVGGELAEPALRAMGWRGRYLVVGFAAGGIPRIPLNLVLLKGCDLLGVFWGAFCTREPAQQARQLARLFGWAAEGRLATHPATVLPLEQTAEAIRLIADRKATGKILVRP